jgi:hypothetical protein
MTQYVPVSIYSGFEGRVTKKALREALRTNPAGITFRVESAFHGDGERINGHHALNRDWTLEVHENGASKATVNFGTDSENGLVAVVS